MASISVASEPRLTVHGTVLTNDQSLIVQVSGDQTGSYEIQSSSDLRSWTPVAQCALPPGGLTFRDSGPPSTHRYYRAVLADSLPADSFLVRPTNGLQVDISPGLLTTADGSQIYVNGGTVQALPGRTSYICLELFDLTFHALPRFIHSGAVLVAEVVANGSQIVRVTQHTVHSIPPTRLGAFKRKLERGEPARILLVGDSLSVVSLIAVEDGWPKLLFGTPASDFHWSLLARDVNFTYQNIAMGGATMRYGMAVIGGTIAPNEAQSACDNIDQALNRIIYTDSLSGGLRSAHDSPFLANPPDLTIVSLGANYTPDEDLFLDTTIRAFRQAGSEVIYQTDNDWLPGTGVTPLIDSPGTIMTIADSEGCAISDSCSFVHEKFDAGVNTYVDIVHQNADGEKLYAAACRSVINDLAQIEEIREPAPLRQTLNTLSAPENRAPNSTLLQFRPNLTTGFYVAARDSARSMAVNIGHIPAESATLILHSGNYATYACSRVLGVDIVYENLPGEAGVLDVSDSTGTNVIQEIRVAGTLDTITWIQTPILNTYQTWSLLQAGAFRDWNQAAATLGLRLTCKSGTVKLAAVVFYTIKGSDIPFESMSFSDGWKSERSALDTPPWRCADAVGEAVTIPFYGNGIEILLHAGSAAGVVSATVDGAAVRSSFNLQRSVDRPLIYSMKIFPASIDLNEPITGGGGSHVLRLWIDNISTNAAPPAPGNRPLAIYWAQALDAR